MNTNYSNIYDGFDNNNGSNSNSSYSSVYSGVAESTKLQPIGKIRSKQKISVMNIYFRIIGVDIIPLNELKVLQSHFLEDLK